MNKLILFIFIGLFFSCKEEKNSNLESKIEAVNMAENVLFTNVEQDKFTSFFSEIPEMKLPFSSLDLSDFMIFKHSRTQDGVQSQTKLLHDKLKVYPDATHFISKNGLKAYKESIKSEFLKGDYFYPIVRFNKDSIRVILYIYQGFEDIMPSIVTQINTYNTSGKILDTLLLDKKFHFELIYYNDFLISKDKISIVKNIKNYYDENDNLIGVDEKPQIEFEKEVFLLKKNGIFKKIE